MSLKLEDILQKYIEYLKNLYGEHLKDVILFGSRARGDNRPDSDIDMIFLLDLDDNEIKLYSKRLSAFTYDFNMDNDIEIMPIVKNKAHYMAWVDAYPFYRNIQKEGIHLYGAA